MAGTALTTLTGALATALRIEGAQPQELLETLKLTVFKGDGTKAPTDAQLTALLVIAQQYRLNPWTKEIYAFPDKGGIVPVVGVDGWLRIINEHPMFNGMEFADGPAFAEGQNKGLPEWIECVMYRKDRDHPIKVREYMVECRRANAGPWQSHPRRMLRHKATIQCARVAFGFAGIYDEDEAGRILENQQPVATPAPGAETAPTPAPTPAPKPAYEAAKWDHNFPKWRDVIKGGTRTAKQYIEWLEQGHTLTDDQRKALRDCEVTDVQPKGDPAATPAPTPAPQADAQDDDMPADEAGTDDESPVTYAQVADKIAKAEAAKDKDALMQAADLIRSVPDVDTHRSELQAKYDAAEKASKGW
jgi:phage recombination protein Bet